MVKAAEVLVIWFVPRGFNPVYFSRWIFLERWIRRKK